MEIFYTLNRPSVVCASWSSSLSCYYELPAGGRTSSLHRWMSTSDELLKRPWRRKDAGTGSALQLRISVPLCSLCSLCSRFRCDGSEGSKSFWWEESLSASSPNSKTTSWVPPSLSPRLHPIPAAYQLFGVREEGDSLVSLYPILCELYLWILSHNPWWHRLPEEIKLESEF